MYSSSRKRRCLRSNRKLKAKTFTSIRSSIVSSILIVIFFSLTSCTTTSNKEKASVVDLSQGICLSGSGKGRLVYPTGRHLFSYETLLEPTKKVWSLAVEVPLRGEEVMELHYKDAHKNIVAMSGSFVRAIISETKGKKKNGNKDLRAFKVLMRRVGAFLQVYEKIKGAEIAGLDCKIENSSGLCNYDSGKKNISWTTEGEKLLFISPISKNTEIVAEFSRLQKSFEKMTFGVRDKRKVGPDATVMELSMFQSGCDAKSIK